MRPDTQLSWTVSQVWEIQSPADSAVLTRVKLDNSRHLMGYVTYFLLTRKVSFYGCLVSGTFSVGVILALNANRLVLLSR